MHHCVVFRPLSGRNRAVSAAILLATLSTGWVAATPPLPAGWAAAIGRGDMLHRTLDPSAPALDPRLRPSVGNGRLATIVGSNNVYLAGVYNSVLPGEPYRARFPGLSAMRLATAPRAPPLAPAPTPWPSIDWAEHEALDMARAAFLQVRLLTVSPGCNVTVEQRTYAHRTRPTLLVTDFVLSASQTCPAGQLKVRVAAGDGASPTTGAQDFNWTAVSPPAAAVPSLSLSLFAGSTGMAEERGRLCNAAFATLAPLSGGLDLGVTAGQRTVHSFPTAFVSDIDFDAPIAVAVLAATATAELAAAAAVGSADALFAEHAAAVATERRARIDVQGNLELARVVNVTLYSLRAALSATVNWSTAPGGLSTGGRFTADGVDTHPNKGGYAEGGSSYYGHVFWDADVWMLPAMLPLFPDVAKAMLSYRFNTMASAVAEAHAQGLNGTKWVWESAFSGASAAGPPCQEIHLQAGIGLAIRQTFRLTHDVTWLRATAWPMLANIVAFFESRATACPTDSSTRLCLNGVESPNEYARGINNDIYTNAAFASLLEWVSVAAEVLGKDDAGRYAALGRRILIPFNTTLDRHDEYSGAPQDLKIKQATAAMLPFPAGYDMPAQVQRNDLIYEAAHIGNEGPAMTHSMLAINWLQLNNASAGNVELTSAFDTNLVGPFLQWMECPLPPDLCQGHRPATNFLTAAGGFIQAVVYGFGQLRYNDANLTLAPSLALNSTGMALHGVQYRGAELSIVWSGSMTSVKCTDHCDAALPLCAASVADAGAQQKLVADATVQFRADAPLLVIAPCATP